MTSDWLPDKYSEQFVNSMKTFESRHAGAELFAELSRGTVGTRRGTFFVTGVGLKT